MVCTHDVGFSRDGGLHTRFDRQSQNFESGICSFFGDGVTFKVVVYLEIVSIV